MRNHVPHVGDEETQIAEGHTHENFPVGHSYLPGGT